MAELEGTHHFDGDGCAVYDRSDQVALFPGHGKRYAARRQVWAEDLKEGDIWQDDGKDGPLTWWVAEEVVILDGDGDEVHVEFSAYSLG